MACNCISFGRWNRQMLFFLFMSLMIFVNQMAFSKLYIFDFNFNDNWAFLGYTTFFKKDPDLSLTHLALFDSFGYFLALIPEIAQILINRTSSSPQDLAKKSTIRLKSKFTLVPRNDGKKNIVLMVFILIAVSVIMSTFSRLSVYFGTYFETFFLDLYFTNTIVFNGEFIVIALLSFCIFRMKIHRHQVVAVGINIIGIFIAYAGTFLFSSTEYFPVELLVFVFFIGLLHSFLMAFIDMSEKYLMLNKDFSPFRILIYEGCVSFALYILTMLVAWMAFGTPPFSKFYCATGYDVFMVFLYFISGGLSQIFRILIINEYSPSHRIIPETLSGVWVIIHKLALYENSELLKDSYYLIFLISFPIRIFACLMFNEILILNFCSLNVNTAGHIKERGMKEYKLNETEITMIEIELNDIDPL